MNACENKDRLLWKQGQEDDITANTIHVTDQGGIGIQCGGHAIVAPLKSWHEAGEIMMCVNTEPCWKYNLAMWLLKSIKRNYKR